MPTPELTGSIGRAPRQRNADAGGAAIASGRASRAPNRGPLLSATCGALRPAGGSATGRRTPTCSRSAPSRPRGVAYEMPVGQRRRVCVASRPRTGPSVAAPRLERSRPRCCCFDGQGAARAEAEVADALGDFHRRARRHRYRRSRRPRLRAGWGTAACPALLRFVRTTSRWCASALAPVAETSSGGVPALRRGGGARACDSYGEAPAFAGWRELRFSDGGTTGVASPAELVVRVGRQGVGWGGLSCWGWARWLAR